MPVLVRLKDNNIDPNMRYINYNIFKANLKSIPIFLGVILEISYVVFRFHSIHDNSNCPWLKMKEICKKYAFLLNMRSSEYQNY